MPLFEVAILERPTKKERSEGSAEEKLVFGPKAVIASDTQAAGIRAVMENKESIDVSFDRMQVIVRPFG